jgi:hypothetical protein
VRPCGPGDLARIPAGVPHAVLPSGSEPWEMLVVKVRRPAKPLKRTPDAGRRAAGLTGAFHAVAPWGRDRVSTRP